MGFGLHVEFDHLVDDAPDFVNWSSKGMVDALAMGYEVFGFGSILDKVAERLDLDVSLLHKVTNPEYGIDDFIGGIPPDHQEEIAKWSTAYREFDTRRELSWQSPDGLHRCIENLIKGLDSNPNIYEEVGVDPDPYGKYFLSGGFRRELEQLLKKVSWADDHGIRRLRLVWI